MMKADENLWSVKIAIAQIPDSGLRINIEADPAVCAAMTDAARVRSVAGASASFDIKPASRETFHVTGLVKARIGQDCVVTLEPIESAIEESIDVMFEPVGDAHGREVRPGSPVKARKPPVTDDDGEEEPDAPEPILNGQMDLGRLAQDFLFLGIDPYPRKPGVVFDVPQAAPDPEDHPFAALKALKDRAESPAKGKPKRR